MFVRMPVTAYSVSARRILPMASWRVGPQTISLAISEL